MSVVRVVLDTNCLVSALIFSRSRFAWLREAWQAKRIIALASRVTVSELLRVLAYPKFKLSRDEQETLLKEILPFVECYYFQKYIQQYDKLFSKKAMALLHPSPFSWEDYDLIAKRITRAYKLWKFCGSGK